MKPLRCAPKGLDFNMKVLFVIVNNGPPFPVNVVQQVFYSFASGLGGWLWGGSAIFLCPCPQVTYTDFDDRFWILQLFSTKILVMHECMNAQDLPDQILTLLDLVWG